MCREGGDKSERNGEHVKIALPFFSPLPTTPTPPRAEKHVQLASLHRKTYSKTATENEYSRGKEYPTESAEDRHHRHPPVSASLYEKERKKGHNKPLFHSGETGRSSAAAPTFTTVLPASVSLSSSDVRWPLYSTTTYIPDQRPVDQVLGEYAIGETIGRGSFGKVKRGRHMATNELVAIKILDYVKLKAAKMDRRIFSEIKILRLFSHPNICKLYDVIQTPTHIFLIMEYVEGGELFDYIVKEGKVKEVEVRYIFQQIICALEYCHHYRVVHRDLKPENILLAPGLQVKLIDFGLSSIMQDGEFLATSCGSANYAAPEVICGKLYCGPEVDIWSCGVILYALINGMLPFDDTSSPALFAMIRKGRYTIPPSMPKPVVHLVGQLLCVDPLKRLTIPQLRDNTWFNTRLPPRLSYASSISYTMKTPRIVFPVLNELGRRLHCTWKELLRHVNTRAGFVYTAYQILVDVDVNKEVANELSSILRMEEEEEKEEGMAVAEKELEKQHESGGFALPSFTPSRPSQKKKNRHGRRERFDSPAGASLSKTSPHDQKAAAPRSSSSSSSSSSSTAMAWKADGPHAVEEDGREKPSSHVALTMVRIDDHGTTGKGNASTEEGSLTALPATPDGFHKHSLSSREKHTEAHPALHTSPSPSPRGGEGGRSHPPSPRTTIFTAFAPETGTGFLDPMELPSSPLSVTTTRDSHAGYSRRGEAETKNEADEEDDEEDEEEEEEEDWLAPYPFPRVAALRELNLGLLLSQSPVMEALLDRQDAAVVKDTYNCCMFVPASFLSEGGVSGGVSRMMSRSNSGLLPHTPSVMVGRRDDSGYSSESGTLRSQPMEMSAFSHAYGETPLPPFHTTGLSTEVSPSSRVPSPALPFTSEGSGLQAPSMDPTVGCHVTVVPKTLESVDGVSPLCITHPLPYAASSSASARKGGGYPSPSAVLPFPPTPTEAAMRRRSKEGEGEKVFKNAFPSPSLSPPPLPGNGERRGSGGHALFGSFPMSHGSCHTSAGYPHYALGYPMTAHSGYSPPPHLGGRGLEGEHPSGWQLVGSAKDRVYHRGEESYSRPLYPPSSSVGGTPSPPIACPPFHSPPGWGRGMGMVEENRMGEENGRSPREFLPMMMTGMQRTPGDDGGTIMTTVPHHHRSPRAAHHYLVVDPSTPGCHAGGEGGGGAPFHRPWDRAGGLLARDGSSLEESVGSNGVTPLVGSVASSCVAYTAHERQFMVANNCGWRLGIMSDLSTEKLLKGLYGVLKKSEMQWKVLSPFSILTRTTPMTWEVMRCHVSETSCDTNGPPPKAVPVAVPTPIDEKDTHKDCNTSNDRMIHTDTNNTIHTNTNKDSTDNGKSNDASGVISTPFKEVQIGIQIFRLHEKHDKGFLVDWRVKNSSFLLSGLDIVYHLSNQLMDWGRELG